MSSKTKKFVDDARPWPKSDAPARKAGAAGGVTVVELLVVMGVIATVIALAVPAINSMEKSYNSSGAVSMINSALSAARTLATTRQQYVGLRFQTSFALGDVLDEEQYMIFVIHDEEVSNWDCGFIALKGYKPIKLPSNVGVIDKTVRNTRSAVNCGGSYTQNDLSNFNVASDIVDTMTFSVVFSPAGRLVIHEVRCRNNDQAAGSGSKDQVFNLKDNVEDSSPIGMFVEDYNNDSDGLGVEKSRNRLYIYDREKLRKMTDSADRWDYIDDIQELYINAYTGAIIK